MYMIFLEHIFIPLLFFEFHYIICKFIRLLFVKLSVRCYNNEKRLKLILNK